MADNVAYTPSGSTLFATKDDGTAHHQKTIMEGQNLAGTAIGLGKAEDEAHSSGDGGIMFLAVRKDTAAALAGTDGDYAPLEVDANGRLHVTLGATKIDDAAFTPATDPVVMVGAEFDDASPDSVDEGDAGALRMSGRRELYVQLRDAAGNERGVNVSAANALKVDGSAVTQPVSGTVTASNTAGDVAHDTADSGNPVKIGAKGIAHGANPTAVTADDRTNLHANRHGILFTIGGHPNVITRRDNFSSTQTDIALVTVSSGTKIVVTSIQVTADNAMTATPAVTIGFGATNTPTGAGVLASHPGLPGGGGFGRGDGSGILGVGADGEDLRVTAGAATGGSITVVTSYFTIDS